MEEAYIVHVDDDKDDTQWLKESFSMYSNISVCHYPDANSFLNDISSFKDQSTPCLFVIDINLPDIKGLDRVPIVVYTTGYSPAEKASCDKLGVELFKKPNTVQEWDSIGKIMALRCHSMMNS
jgi:CheY-like chemotaxis protein